MNSAADISSLYQEFTEALTEVLAENAAVRLAADGSHGRALPSKNIPNIQNTNIFWQSKQHF